MDEMREIVDIRTVDAAIKIGGAVWFGVCLLAGLLRLVGVPRSSSLKRGLYVGLIGPMVVALWLLWSWMTCCG